ncbi:MAG TPA: hypothetical protein VNM70_15860 [Burkholderiales bacterium]|nr:hypothetical protein [Burkholderiales bacterium]
MPHPSMARPWDVGAKKGRRNRVVVRVVKTLMAVEPPPQRGEAGR